MATCPVSDSWYPPEPENRRTSTRTSRPAGTAVVPTSSVPLRAANVSHGVGAVTSVVASSNARSKSLNAGTVHRTRSPIAAGHATRYASTASVASTVPVAVTVSPTSSSPRYGSSPGVASGSRSVVPDIASTESRSS